MGRTNRSRKRKDEMNRVKRERNAKKELLRLKKTLGLLDENGIEIIKKVTDIADVKTPEEIKNKKKLEEEAELVDEKDFVVEENVSVINENTKKVHIYNTKTMKDQYGTVPIWKRQRSTAKRQRKLEHSRKLNFNQAWCAKFVPL